MARLDGKIDAQMICRTSQAEKKLSLGLHHDCFEILNEIKERLETLPENDP